MDNAYNIIDSISIRNYFSKIHYEMDSIELSWFIHRSNNIQYNDKILLYQNVINNYKNMLLNNDWLPVNISSLSIHELLEKYIKILNKRENIDYNITNKEELPIEQLEIENIFDCMYFNFPNPFKFGDILYCKRNKYFDGGPFVYTKLDSAINDPLQMVGYGYTQDKGTIYHDCIGVFIDFEYYNENLSDFNNLLKMLNLHIKGKIDYKIFLNAYKNLLFSNISLICKNNEDQNDFNYYSNIKE